MLKDSITDLLYKLWLKLFILWLPWQPIDFVTFLKAAIESPMHVDEITPLKEEEGLEAEVKEESEEKPIVNQVNSAPVS